GASEELAVVPIASSRHDPRLLYGVNRDGSWSAYRDEWSGPGPLHLVNSDGSTVDVDLGATAELAPQAASFSPDGTKLAVADGSIAYLHLNDDGSYVVRSESKAGVADVAEVGFIHGGFDISADGVVAYSDGTTTWIVDTPGGKARLLGPGGDPRFSPDGQAVV